MLVCRASISYTIGLTYDTIVLACSNMSSCWSGWKENIMNPIVFGILIILLVGISPVVHNKAGKKYSFPLAGLAIYLLAFQF